jgi:hypothetical protein
MVARKDKITLILSLELLWTSEREWRPSDKVLIQPGATRAIARLIRRFARVRNILLRESAIDPKTAYPRSPYAGFSGVQLRLGIDKEELVLEQFVLTERPKGKANEQLKLH